MKKMILIVMIFTLLFLLYNCKNNTLLKNSIKLKQVGGVRLRISSSRASAIGDKETFLITLRDGAGKPIFNQKRLPLYSMGWSYITGSLQLSPGSYSLTEFMMIDVKDELISAAPREESRLSYHVSNPLSIDFTIVKDRVTEVDVELIDANGYQAADFGYSLSGLKLTKSSPLLITVPGYDKGGSKIIFSRKC